MSSKRHILVLGVDPFHRPKLHELSESPDVPYKLNLKWRLKEFKGINTREQLEKLVGKLSRTIEDENISGIAGYWDFPVTLLQGYFNSKYGFKGASLESVLKCEHKLWARKEQAQILKEEIPKFIGLNIYQDPIEQLKELELPYWIKPVKSCASALAFRIESRNQEAEVIRKMQSEVGKVASPFSFFLDQVDLPDHISRDSGHYCIAEECMHGLQVTMEGVKWRGQVTSYAFFDDRNDKFDRSFLSYEYPSRLPEKVRGKMHDIAVKVLDRIGFDNSTFNIEFFYDEDKGTIQLLEINPRISQSHTLPILWVDGFSTLKLTCDIAAEQAPHLRYRQGSHTHAGKFFLRHYSDAKVEHAPSEEEIEFLKKKYPEVELDITAKEGRRLSEQFDQDSYSYEMALIYMNADSWKEMISKSSRLRKELAKDFDLRR